MRYNITVVKITTTVYHKEGVKAMERLREKLIAAIQKQVEVLLSDSVTPMDREFAVSAIKRLIESLDLLGGE